MNHTDKGIVIHKKYLCLCEPIVQILKRMYTIIETTKGKPCLIYNNYRYLRDRIRSTNTYWRCAKRSECSGRVVTQKAGQDPILTASHNQEPDENKNKHKIFITNLKRPIREDPMPMRKIFRSELINRYTHEHDNVCTLLKIL